MNKKSTEISLCINFQTFNLSLEDSYSRFLEWIIIHDDWMEEMGK